MIENVENAVFSFLIGRPQVIFNIRKLTHKSEA